jgi:ABC-type transport system involved in multi-copper enzyme maturation permease subunit
VMGINFGWGFREGLWWLIGLEMAAGSLMIGWAIARLRPLSRKLEDGEGGRVVHHRWRLISRPPCGESPVLWKEMHTAKTAGFTQLSETLAIAAIFGLIAYGAFHFGGPAVLEWLAYLAGQTPTEASRTDFNVYLRGITSVVELVCLILIGGAAAESIASERAQATWDSLLATPLSRHEVVCGKMIGAAWKARWGLVLLLSLWSAGLLAGSLHPLGFVAALVLLIVSTWFMASLGTYASLVSRHAAHATARTTIALVLLTCTFMFCYFSGRYTSVIIGAGSVPFVNFLCLVTYRDVAEAVGPQTAGYLNLMGISTGEGAVAVLNTYLMAVAGYAAAAACFTWAAFWRFDRLVGRPKRGAACDNYFTPVGAPRLSSADALPAPNTL